MNAPLSGPGLGLPLAQNLYPSELFNAPYDMGTSRVCLAPGEQLPLPAGDWYVGMGAYLVMQFKDPITGLWVYGSGSAYNRGVQFVKSDGFNCRIANLTGCPVGAVISSQGASYVQSSTTISVTGGGGSTWAPLVGGALAFVGASVASTGAGYGVAPIMIIPQPPPANSNVNGLGGIPASGYAAISSGTVVLTGVTFTNPGAGYPAAPANIALLPNPTDPNLSTGITLATCAFSLTNSGAITGVFCTNPGAPLALPASISLAVSGAGVTATISAVYMQTLTAASVNGNGAGYGTGQYFVTTIGGVPGTGTITNGPDSLYLAWIPRPAQVGITPANTSVSVGSPGVVYDGGLFVCAAAPALTGFAPAPGGSQALGTVATITGVFGSRPDIAVIQPAP